MGEQTFFGKVMGNYFKWGLMIRSCKGKDGVEGGGKGGVTNAFSSNLNSVNLKIFPGHGERHTGK